MAIERVIELVDGELRRQYEWLRRAPVHPTLHGYLARRIALESSDYEDFKRRLASLESVFKVRESDVRGASKYVKGPAPGRCTCGYHTVYILKPSAGGEHWRSDALCPVGVVFAYLMKRTPQAIYQSDSGLETRKPRDPGYVLLKPRERKTTTPEVVQN